MVLARHSAFADLPDIFTATLGDLTPFTTPSGLIEFQAIIREEADELGEASGGIGVIGDYATCRLATAAANFLTEGDTFVHQTITFKLSSEAMDDGRGMSTFEIKRIV